MKKIHLLIFSTLFAVFCFTTCDIFFGRSTADMSNYSKVIVNITGVGVDDTSARTVYPNMLFEKYKFVFTRVNNIGVIIETLEPKELESGETFVFELELGNWQVIVSAYAKIDDTTPAASGKSNTFTITSSSTVVTTDVQLDKIENTGSGTFSYHITYPDGAAVNHFTLEKLFEEETEIIDLLDGETSKIETITPNTIMLSGTLDIPAGYYFLTIYLEKGERGTGANEVIYIYDKLGSDYGTENEPVVFTDDYFSKYPKTLIVINFAEMNEWELIEQTSQAIANEDNIFSVTGSYTTYRWYLDGVLVGSSSSYTFNKPEGVYQLAVVVTNNNGESRSGRCWVTVPFIYTITYDRNGGIGSIPATQYVVDGSSIELASSNNLNLQRPGYIISGWNTRADGTGINYNFGAVYTSTGNITLYARWIQTYTVTYSGNGGTGTPSSQSVIVGNSITINSGDSLTRSGYRFNGWNTSANGTGTSYNGGAFFTPTSNITLYAQWIIYEVNVFHLGALTEDRWTLMTGGGIFTNANDTIGFSIPVTSGTTYYIWWNDRFSSVGGLTGNIAVSARYANANSWIFGGTNTTVDSGWDTPQSFTADRTGTVEVRIIPWNRSSSSLGSWAIVYRTINTRPNY